VPTENLTQTNPGWRLPDKGEAWESGTEAAGSIFDFGLKLVAASVPKVEKQIEPSIA